MKLYERIPLISISSGLDISAQYAENLYILNEIAKLDYAEAYLFLKLK